MPRFAAFRPVPGGMGMVMFTLDPMPVCHRCDGDLADGDNMPYQVGPADARYFVCQNCLTVDDQAVMLDKPAGEGG